MEVFFYKYEGHFGDGTDTGRYTSVEDIILLIPDTDWESELHGVLKEKIRIVSENCIRDFDNNFYCLDLESINYYHQLTYNFEEKAIDAIDSLPIVIKEKKRLMAYVDISKRGFEPQIGYNRIFVVNKEEYHSFILIRNIDGETHRYLNFLVKEKPFQIYEHHGEGDSLSLVYSE